MKILSAICVILVILGVGYVFWMGIEELIKLIKWINKHR